MVEYRTEQVTPGTEEQVVEILAHFGWELLDADEHYSERNVIDGARVHEYGAFMQGYTGDVGRVDVQSHKEITHYVTLKFGRTDEQPNYQRLRELNAEYEQLLGYPEPKRPWGFLIGFIAAVAVFIAYFVMQMLPQIQAGQYHQGDLVQDLIFAVIAVVLLVLTVVGFVRYKKQSQVYAHVVARLPEIIAEADSLR